MKNWKNFIFILKKNKENKFTNQDINAVVETEQSQLKLEILKLR